VARDISPFGAQGRLDEDLPNVIKNMFREYASNPDVPDDLELSERLIRNVCDQRDIGPVSLNIGTRLSAEIADFPFEVEYQSGLDADELQTLVDEPEFSYPTVSLSQQEYDPTGYEIDTDKNGHARKLYVLVMAVNHNEVLLYDPLRYAAVENPNGIEATEVPKPMFVNAWEGRLESTSTLWIRSTEQTRISRFER
jgi:hypothetical protein